MLIGVDAPPTCKMSDSPECERAAVSFVGWWLARKSQRTYCRESRARMMEPVLYTGNMVDLSDLDADGVRSRRGYWHGASNEMGGTGRERTLRGGLSPCSRETRVYIKASRSLSLMSTNVHSTQHGELSVDKGSTRFVCDSCKNLRRLTQHPRFPNVDEPDRPIDRLSIVRHNGRGTMALIYTPIEAPI